MNYLAVPANTSRIAVDSPASYVDSLENIPLMPRTDFNLLAQVDNKGQGSMDEDLYM